MNQNISPSNAFEAFFRQRNILKEGHVEYPADIHRTLYLDFHLLSRVVIVRLIAQSFARNLRERGIEIDYVIGLTNIEQLANQLALLHNVPVAVWSSRESLYASIPPDTAKGNALLIVDFIEPGIITQTIKELATAIRQEKGAVVLVTTIVNNRRVKAEQLGAALLIDMVKLEEPSFTSTECARYGPCSQGITLNII